MDLFSFFCRNEQQVFRLRLGMTTDAIFSEPEE